MQLDGVDLWRGIPELSLLVLGLDLTILPILYHLNYIPLPLSVLGSRGGGGGGGSPTNTFLQCFIV